MQRGCTCDVGCAEACIDGGCDYGCRAWHFVDEVVVV